ncbi:MAG: hypothetical protein PCFJNLEI_01929 [Verrucomicrobiae bacterium]|nr:hypothetical protein [Verrucomicrobiae bacterium]
MKTKLILGISIGLVSLAGYAEDLTIVGNVSVSNQTVLAAVVQAAPVAEVDSDGDGFTDRQEEVWNTHPQDENSCPPLFDKVQGWWPLADGAGTAVADASVNALGGTIIGAAPSAWVADLGEMVLATDGGQAAVQISDHPKLNPTTGLTLVALVKAAAGTSGMIVGKCRVDATRLQTGKNRGGSFALGLQDGKPVVELWVGGEYRPLFSPQVVADGEWHSLAVAYDGFEVRLYVDGKRSVATHIGGELDGVAEPLVIGRLAARLADVGLLDRALDDGELILLQELSGVPVRDAGEAQKLSARPRRVPVGLLARRVEARKKQAEAGPATGSAPVIQTVTNAMAVAEGGR